MNEVVCSFVSSSQSIDVAGMLGGVLVGVKEEDDTERE